MVTSSKINPVYNLMLVVISQLVTSCSVSDLPDRFSQSPPGMVWIPGGEFTMGCDSPDAHNDEKPSHTVCIDGFWMDTTLVTNRQFQAFVDATGYVTTAEKAPELLLPASFVFKMTEGPVSMHSNEAWWELKSGANWRHPLGHQSSIEGKEDHPVVQVSWFDAVAYAKWAGKRLPTEAEWEFAAYGGQKNIVYVWGNEEYSEETPQANIWHGEFPYKSTKPAGCAGTTAVKTYKPNPYGLYDMAGNVWQWCSDLYHASHYQNDADKKLVVNPSGPATSFDPAEPFAVKHVHRGGSFLCHKSYCKGYRITARMKTCPDTSLNHLGFRCAMSPASQIVLDTE